jgi:membrane associated rhomboid family serine protease
MTDSAQEQHLAMGEPLTRPMIGLLVACTAVFLLQILVEPFNRFADTYLVMDTAAFLRKLYLWQAVTSIFLHGNVQHWLGNMIFLWFFGSALANAWRSREFLTYFFLCGIAGSVCFYVFNSFRNAESIKGLGASGAIFGLMIAYAMVFGERVILAFFLIPMKAKYFVGFMFAIEILLLWTSTQDGIGHIAHLGGAVAGAIYLKIVWRRQNALAGESDGRRGPGSRMRGLEVMKEDRE